MKVDLFHVVMAFSITLRTVTPIAEEVKPLSEQEFLDLHQQLVQPTAAWRTIPWETSVIRAQHLPSKRISQFLSGQWTGIRLAAHETTACSTVS